MLHFDPATPNNRKTDKQMCQISITTQTKSIRYPATERLQRESSAVFGLADDL